MPIYISKMSIFDKCLRICPNFISGKTDRSISKQFNPFIVKHFFLLPFLLLLLPLQLQLQLGDITGALALQIKDMLDKYSGKTPFNIRIYEKGKVFYSDFFNFAAKVDPESFVRDFTLPAEYKLVLEG